MAGNYHFLYNPYRTGMCMEISLLLFSMHKATLSLVPDPSPAPAFWVEGLGMRLKVPLVSFPTLHLPPLFGWRVWE